MAYKYEKRFKVMQITEDGTVKVPEPTFNGWKNVHMFGNYYETEESAINVIKIADGWDSFVILPVIVKIWKSEED